MSPFSQQGQNLCGLSLAFIIDWRVVWGIRARSLGGGEGGSWALGSPVNSHISSVSRNAPGGGGLTESNVARFNNQRASHSNSNSNAPTPVQVNAMGQNSALVNTLDLVSAANAFKSMPFQSFSVTAHTLSSSIQVKLY